MVYLTKGAYHDETRRTIFASHFGAGGMAVDSGKAE